MIVGITILKNTTSNSVIAEDLHPGNIWMTGDSNVVIIDGAFKFNTPGLGLGGKFLY